MNVDGNGSVALGTAPTFGGTVALGTTNLVVRGGFLRNNGTITGTGNLVIDFGGLVKGGGRGGAEGGRGAAAGAGGVSRRHDES